MIDPNIHVKVATERDDLLVEVERLKQALDRFGEHRSDLKAERLGEAGAVCELVSTTSWSPGQRKPVCTCGLDAALKGGG